MAELADALDLGSNAQKACRFKSCSRHHINPNRCCHLIVCTYHDNAVKLDEEDRTVQFTIKRPGSPPSPERFAVWVRQSVNRAAQDLYTQTFGELMLAGSIGALYCTRSELLAGVLKMQIRPTDSIPVHTTNTVMNLELPFLTDVQIDQLNEGQN
jgi:hypothetical protein